MILLQDTLQVEVWADMTNLGKGRKDEHSFCGLGKGKIDYEPRLPCYARGYTKKPKVDMTTHFLRCVSW